MPADDGDACLAHCGDRIDRCLLVVELQRLKSQPESGARIEQ